VNGTKKRQNDDDIYKINFYQKGEWLQKRLEDNGSKQITRLIPD